MPMIQLSNRHKESKRRIEETPTLANIKWTEVVSLLEALGCTVAATKGSMYRIAGPHGKKMVAHRPHPGNECNKGLVERIRDFLEGIDD